MCFRPPTVLLDASCPECGAPLQANTNKCAECGAELKVTGSEPPPAVPRSPGISVPKAPPGAPKASAPKV